MRLSTLLWHAAPLASVMFVMSITPGPNNVLVLSSGGQFGVLRTLPHLLGITFGFVALLLAVYAGVGATVGRIPGFSLVLTLLSSVYLIWIAWFFVRSRPENDSGQLQVMARQRPFTWMEAAVFQFVNPKAWAMAAACVGIASEWPMGAVGQAGLLVIVAAVVNFPCILLWAVGGSSVSRWLSTPKAHRIFNTSMAALIVATVVWMLWDWS